MKRHILVRAALAAVVLAVPMRLWYLPTEARTSVPARHVVALQARASERAFTPACATVLRLTPDSFSLVYSAQVRGMSDAALDEAAAYWARCRQQATTVAVAGNPTLAAQIGRFRTLFAAVQQAEYAIQIQRAGGGTLYLHILNRAVTDREQLLADIAAVAGGILAGAPSSGYAMIIDPEASDIEGRLQLLQHPSKSDLQYTTKHAWLTAVTAYANAIHAAEAAAGTKNDATRTLVVSFLDRPLFLNQPAGAPGQ